MKNIKKILIVLLTVTLSLFLIKPNQAAANADFTLDQDGYYYYSKEIRFKNISTESITLYIIESGNGNPLEIRRNESSDWIKFSHRIQLSAIFDPYRGTDHPNDVDTWRVPYEDKRAELNENIKKASGTFRWKEVDGLEPDSFIPVQIRYESIAYNKNTPGDLNISGQPEYNLLEISKEEYLEQPSYNRKTMQVDHDYSIYDIKDKNFVKYILKHDYYNDFDGTPGYNFETATYKVVQPLGREIIDNEYLGDEINYQELYYKTIFKDVIRIYDFNDLPTTASTFENNISQTGIVNFNKLNETEYDITVDYDNNIYMVKVDNVPEFIFNSKKVYYFTDKNNRFMVGFYESDGFKDTTDFNQNMIENSWIFWNLNTGEYTRSETNTVHVKISNESDGFSYQNQLYADVVIPHLIDDLLSISVFYEYRHVYLIGDPGKWTAVNNQVLLKDEKGTYELPWYNSLFGFYNWAINSFGPTQDLFGIDQIKEVEVDEQYKLEYVDWLKKNGSGEYSVDSIFIPDAKTYSLYLGTFNKWWSVGLDVKEFGVMSYRYEYKGVEYSNPFPDTETGDLVSKSPLDPFLKWLKNLLNIIWGWIINAVYIAIPIIGLITFPFIFKGLKAVFGKKIHKRRTLLAIVWIGLLFILWFSLV